MTPPDWADEEAGRVYLPDLMDASQVFALNRDDVAAYATAVENKHSAEWKQRDRIAAALRAAFIRGLREAAEILKRGPDGDRAGEGIAILAAADKLEKGEA